MPIYRQWIKNNRGNALIEFAMTLPVLLILMFGIIEVTRLIIIHQKLDKAVFAVADGVTKFDEPCINTGELNGIINTALQVMDPFTGTDVTVTSVTNIFSEAAKICSHSKHSTRPCLSWQHPATASSMIGNRVGEPPRFMPGGVTVEPGQSIIFAEAFYDYTPMLSASQNFLDAIAAPKRINKWAAYKPRTTSISEICH